MGVEVFSNVPLFNQKKIHIHNWERFLVSMAIRTMKKIVTENIGQWSLVTNFSIFLPYGEW